MSDTWPGRVILGRANLGLRAFPEAYSELEVAIKRQGEATALYLDDVPTYRHFPPAYYYMGLAQSGLMSPAAKASFASYVAIKQGGDGRGFLEDARRRAGGG
ncbi:MAG TPA: hypothetical protein VMW48_17095 [Vicinamibacterales bacterium]|nr:hypothetical protein [Vicinamibacterales bacterium]